MEAYRSFERRFEEDVSMGQGDGCQRQGQPSPAIFALPPSQKEPMVRFLPAPRGARMLAADVQLARWDLEADRSSHGAGPVACQGASTTVERFLRENHLACVAARSEIGPADGKALVLSVDADHRWPVVRVVGL